MHNNALEVFDRITTALISSLDLAEIFKIIIKDIRDGLGFDRAGIFLVDKKENIIQGVLGTDVSGDFEDIADEIFPLLDDNNYFADIASGKISEFYTDDAENILPQSQRKYLVAGVKQNAIVPMHLDGVVIGMIAIDNLISKKDFGPADLYLLRLFAKQAALAIRNAKVYAKTKELDRIKSDFFSSVSHELKTPLIIVKEAVQLLKCKEDDVSEKVITIINNNIDRLLRLVDSLLDLSKIESGEIKLSKKTIDFDELLKKLYSEFEIQTLKKGIKLSIDIKDKIGSVNADEFRIIQLISNLVTNALKFTSEGEINIYAKKQGDSVFVAISDNGIGIPNEDLEKIFSKFYQVDRNITKIPGGVGLGLAICRAIVDAHGGRIWAESEGQGKGSRFSFILPL